MTLSIPRMPLGMLLVAALSNATSAQPYAFTQPVTFVQTNSATLSGMITPRGLPTTGWFEWGTNTSFGQITSPVSVGSGTRVVRVSTLVESLNSDSAIHYCRLVASNSAGVAYGWPQSFTTGARVASWGSPMFLPPGSFMPPGFLHDIVAIAGGDYHGLALRSNGTVTNWGRFLVQGPSFQPPAGLSNVVAIAGGRDHALVVKPDGSVLAWGSNSSGQTNVPVSASNVVAVSAGDAHSLALRMDGAVIQWGAIGSIPFGLSNVVSIACGDTYCLALRNNGTVAGWGNFPFPPVPAGLSNVVAIAAGYTHALALQSNGTVVAWGSGFGVHVPTGLSNVVTIAAGDYHGLALKADGTVVSWGSSANGTSIVPPGGLSEVVSLACGDEFSMALVTSNTPPQSQSRTLTGPLNRDTVLSLGNLSRDFNGDSVNFRILTLPVAGHLFQFNSGARGSLVTETNTPVFDASNRVIFAPITDEFGAPYTSFNVIANDGEDDSLPATATINIVPSPIVTLVKADPFGPAVLTFAGLSNATYSVHTSTNLIDWTQAGQASKPSPGEFLFTDSGATNRPFRFYRVRSP